MLLLEGVDCTRSSRIPCKSRWSSEASFVGPGAYKLTNSHNAYIYMICSSHNAVIYHIHVYIYIHIYMYALWLLVSLSYMLTLVSELAMYVVSAHYIFGHHRKETDRSVGYVAA